MGHEMEKRPGFLPLIFRGDRTRALVVGGGKVARRKIEDLLDAGCEVSAIAPVWEGSLEERMIARGAAYETRAVRAGDTTGFTLVIVATDDPEVNRTVSEEARAAGIPVNVVDQPELCTIYFAAVIRSDPLLVAVSTGGAAPFLAREIKGALADVIEGEWRIRARWAEKIRDFARDHLSDPAQREKVYSAFLAVDDASMLRWNEAAPPLDLWGRWAVEENQ